MRPLPPATHDPRPRPSSGRRRRTRTTAGTGQDIHPLKRALTAATTDSPEPTGATAFDRLVSLEGLAGGWRTVLAKDASDGLLHHATQEIAGHLDDFLAELSASLHDGTYRPSPLVRVYIAKPHGGTRTLRIPAVRDRVVERAVVNTITRDADLVMSPCSFAYRRGMSTDDAVHHLATLRDAGYRHVLRTDVEDFFPNALTVLGPAIACPRTLALLRLIAGPRRAHGERRTRTRGIAQGSCLSPLLANLVLTDVDHALGDAGFGYARFADDIVVCTHEQDDLLHALDILESLLAAHGLGLNREKATMTTFDEGFCYLSVDFSRTAPPVDPHHDVKGHPDLDRVVYVGRDGARVRIAKARLIVDGPDGLPQVSVPRKAVSRLVLTGTVGLSAGARSWALYNDVDVLFLSRHGGYLGQLAGPRSTANARRLLTQAAFASDDDARLPLARAVVRAKLCHQRNVLHRLGRRGGGVDVADACTRIRGLDADAENSHTVDELMGCEGAASNTYFDCLATLVPPEVAFHGRTRRPPKDLTNAAFSYGYAILLAECTAALLAAGLEPSLGVLHASTDKRPSLALDLMEEFRPLLVDRTVMALLRTRQLRPEHATESPDGDGVWLGRDGRKALVDGYEATLQRQVKGALPGFAGTWRQHVHHEAQLLGRAITEPRYRWVGASWR